MGANMSRKVVCLFTDFKAKGVGTSETVVTPYQTTRCHYLRMFEVTVAVSTIVTVDTTVNTWTYRGEKQQKAM